VTQEKRRDAEGVRYLSRRPLGSSASVTVTPHSFALVGA